ncbi:MAG: hypothetical protein ACFFD1_12170, partial [Candidatus Thorarchaeota archaeon]
MKFDNLTVKIISIGIIVLSIYFLYSIFLPIRGYDALFIYFPDALWYYQIDSIPILNLLNFYPAVKEPIPSLFYSFSLFITQSFSVDLIPFIFILAWSLLTVEFVKLLWPDINKNVRWFSWLMFLILPLNIWFMDNWAYYQDIYLGFFFSCAIFYAKKGYMSNDKFYQGYYFVLLSLSICLSLFSKISGWSLLIILVLVFPSQKNIRYFQFSILSGFFLFLSLQIIFRSYIGYVIVIAFVWTILSYLILTQKDSIVDRSRYFITSSSILIGTILGSFWLYEVFQRYSSESRVIIDTYFLFIPKITFNFIPNNPSNPSFILETAQSADFFAGVFLLLVGNYFALFWFLPKIRVIFDKKNQTFLWIWLLVFFSLWLTYYHNGSLRYLTPIIIPFTLLTYRGVLLIYCDIRKRLSQDSLNKFTPESIKKLPILYQSIILFSALLTLYFPIFFNLQNGLSTNESTLGLAYIQTAFQYYKMTPIFLIIIFSLVIFYYLVIKNRISINNKKILFKNSLPNLSRYLAIILLIITFIIPLVVPTYVFITSDSNLQLFQQNYSYENRFAVKDITHFLSIDNTKKDIVLVLNTPGIPVWTSMPTIDLISQQEAVFPFYNNQNISQGLSYMINPIQYISNYENISFPSEDHFPSIGYV